MATSIHTTSSGEKDRLAALKDIKDDGPGKTNWFELEDYVIAIRLLAKERGVPIEEVVRERMSQIEQNFYTVFRKHWLTEQTPHGKKIVLPSRGSGGMYYFLDAVVCKVINSTRSGLVEETTKALDDYRLGYI